MPIRRAANVFSAALIASLTPLAMANLSLFATPVAAQSKDPLKIGVLLPLTGVLGVLGQEQAKGMEFAVQELGGSVAGRKIELFIEDTGGAPATGLQKARKLVTSNNVDVMAGVLASPVALQVAPYFTSIKMPLVISNASVDSLTGKDCSPYVFRVSYSSAQVSEPIGRYLAKTGVKSIFMLAADFVAPKEYITAIKKGYLAGGGKILGEAYPPFAKTQDYGPYISQARNSNPDAVVPIFYGAEAISFMKQWASFGLTEKLPVYSSIGLTPPVLRGAQGDAALNVISSVNYLPELDTPENNRFKAAYRAKHGNDPEEFVIMAYDAIRFIFEAVKARNGDTADREALIKAIAKVSYTGPRGPMSIDARNQSATQNIYIVKTVKREGKVAFELLDTYQNFRDPVEGCNLN